jgi:polyphenol oxidase
MLGRCAIDKIEMMRVPARSSKRARRTRPRPERPTVAGFAWRRRGRVDILAAKSLARLAWLVHGFSTRSGGTRRLPAGRVLNLGFTDRDSRATVEANRRAFAAALGSSGMALATLRQMHSDVIHRLEAAPAEPLRGDALMTQMPGLLLAVQTADCVPVLLADQQRRVIAAIHAGWRGTLARIVAKTVGRMRMEFGCDACDIVAAIGPAIGACCYSVGSEVVQKFAAQFPEARRWFEGPDDRLLHAEAPNPWKWLSMTPVGHDQPLATVQLDLIAANCWQLREAGIPEKNISAAKLCTVCHPHLFFSYRREGQVAGRLLAAIAIRK